MNFVQTGFLAAFAALMIPVIVHLLFKRRSRTVQLGTLRFLRAVIEQNSRRKKLKRWLLLVLRLGAIAALVMLFARPYFAEQTKAGDGRHLVLLLDKSATMQLQHEGQRLVDTAMAQAQEVLNSAGDDTGVEVAWFDHSVLPVAESKVAAGSISLTAPEQCYGSTNYGAALMWARDRLLASDAAKKELYVFTDLQQSGLGWNTVEPLPESVIVTVRDVGRAVVNNVSIASTSAPRTLIRPGDPFLLNATISNDGAFPIEEQIVNLIMKQGEQSVTVPKRMKLGAGELVTVEFVVDGLKSGLWTGTVELDGVSDDLAFDNLRHAAVMVDEQIPVLIVDGKPHSTPILAGSYFLDAALRLAPPGQKFEGSPYQTTVVSLEDGASLPDLKQFHVVALTNVADVSQSDAAKLQTFVAAGGGLLVFCGDNVTETSNRNLDAAGLTIGKITGVDMAIDLPWRVAAWDENHPVLKPFNDPQHGDLRRLAFRGITLVKLAGHSKAIASFRDQVPAVVERTVEQGRVLWFLSGCDRQWGDWTRSRLFLPFVHRLAGRLSGLTDGGPVRELLIDSDHATTPETVPGIVERGRFWEVVNCSPRESEGEQCTVEDFAERFGLTLATAESQTATAQPVIADAGIDLRQDELWPWCLVILFGILLSESFLANRTLA